MINAFRKKNCLYVNFLRNRTLECEQRYKRYENKLTSVLSVCRKDHYAKLINSHTNDIKQACKVLNCIMNSNYKASNAYLDTFIADNKEIHGKDILEGFNKFFTNVGPDLAATIPAQDSSVYAYLDETNTHSMSFTDATEGEVLDIIKNVNNKTSGDSNDLSMSLVKLIISSVAKPFTFICNKSFSTWVGQYLNYCSEV